MVTRRLRLRRFAGRWPGAVSAIERATGLGVPLTLRADADGAAAPRTLLPSIATAGSRSLPGSRPEAMAAATQAEASRCRSTGSTAASTRRSVDSLGAVTAPVNGSGLAPNATSAHAGASAAHCATAGTSSCPAHAVAATATASRNPSS